MNPSKFRDIMVRNSHIPQALIDTVKEDITEIPMLNADADQYARTHMHAHDLPPAISKWPEEQQFMYWDLFAMRTKEVVLLVLAQL